MSLMNPEIRRPGAKLFFLTLMHKILMDEIRHVPDWAQFVAMDASGEIYAFSHVPRTNLFCSCWITQREDSSLIEQIGSMDIIDKQGLDWEQCCLSVSQLMRPDSRQSTGGETTRPKLPAIDEIVSENQKDAWI